MTQQELPARSHYASAIAELLLHYGKKVEAGEINRNAHRIDALLSVLEKHNGAPEEDAKFLAEKLDGLPATLREKRPSNDGLNLALRAQSLLMLYRGISGQTYETATIVPGAVDPADVPGAAPPEM